MLKIEILHKLSCDRCINVIQSVNEIIRECHMQDNVDVNAILIDTRKKAKMHNFIPSLSPMIRINKKYILLSYPEYCQECTRLTGKAMTCGMTLSKKGIKKFLGKYMCRYKNCTCS